MKVNLRFFARFRELIGTEVEVDAEDGATVADAIRQACAGSPEGRAAIFSDSGTFQEHVILMLNGKRLDAGIAADTKVADGDLIAVFPPVAGG
ncbi:MAG: MoaD family protein [Methanomicrobiaceae archaeon]|uniref:Molybdenum cofactor biosynthesis protein moad n=1 Tax=hydrocarbon metagenome TaxID=938273 RepID=A0A0W8FJE6_9ZZZZ|nr:MoaD family protein [Methanomicrobiaceae archaeon]MDD5418278.1 MoaD family protein [Methanomicrobiaceae archaeon]